MFAGQKVIQESVMTRRRAVALEHLIMDTVKRFLIGDKLLIHQVFQALPKVDRYIIKRCLGRNGFVKKSDYTWEKRNAKESVGKAKDTKRRFT
jgi:hypothetical protein